MNVVVDSGLFLASLNHDDPLRERATDFFSASPERYRLLSPEAVYVEVMNYLRRKPTRRKTCEEMRDLRRVPDGPVRWLETDAATVLDAERLYFQHFGNGLSMTDAIVLATAKAVGASVATFDSGFGGLVPLAL